MKIHSTHQSVCSRRPVSRKAIRLLAFCGAVALCVTAGMTASAQSPALGDLTKSSASQTESPAMVRNGLFTHGGDSFAVVNTAAFRTMADVGTPEAGTIAQVGHSSSCRSCGNQCGGSCGGYSNCGSCGTSCGGACGYGGGYGGYGLANPCAPCEPYCYGTIEALYMERDGNDNYTLSRNFRMSGFDEETAARITIGTVPDCVHGCEISYAGKFQWDRAGFASDTDGEIQTLLIAGAPLAQANLSAFSDATFQTQLYRAEYWSVEANKTLMGWDVAKLLAGVRYLEYEERYSYFSQNATDNGLLRSAVDNRMFGLQVGMDLLFPISTCAYTDFRSRLGAYANSVDSLVQVNNAGFVQVLNIDDTTDLAGVFEVGGGLRLQLGQILSVRAGGELWYMAGMATSSHQLRSNVITPSTGRSARTSDEVVIAGLTLGAELKF